MILFNVVLSSAKIHLTKSPEVQTFNSGLLDVQTFKAGFIMHP